MARYGGNYYATDGGVAVGHMLLHRRRRMAGHYREAGEGGEESRLPSPQVYEVLHVTSKLAS